MKAHLFSSHSGPLGMAATFLLCAVWACLPLSASAQDHKTKISPTANAKSKSGAAAQNSASEKSDAEPPPAFAPMAHLVGGWKGTEIPAANKLKGSVVKHNWAWRFDKGAVVGMSVEFANSQVLSKANLDYDEPSKSFRLAGRDAKGKPVVYRGSMDKNGKMLSLKREGTSPDGSEETLTVRILPDNKIRYAVWVDEKSKAALRPTRTYEIGLTKEGEAFASASAAASLPKCIITGGAAGLTVSFQGRTFPVCCSGCQSQFNENPEKYVARVDKLAAETSKGDQPRKMEREGDRGEFGETEASSAKTKPSSEDDVPAAETDPKALANAKTWFRLAQAFERQGNTKNALNYYRKIVKDTPGAPQAKEAAARIKALGGS